MMKRWRGLARPLIMIGLLSGLVGMLSGGIVAVGIAANLIAQRTSGLLAAGVATRWVGQCAAQPATWRQTVGDLEIFAYDGVGRALNPAAPPLERDLLAAIQDGRSAAGAVHFLDERGGTMLVRVAPAGPCSLARISWRRDIPLRVRSTAWLILLVLLPVGVTTALGAVWVMRPTLVRIAALDVAARDLGGPAYRSAGLAGSDELDRLSGVLDRAQARIVADARTLKARAAAIEEHLAHVAHDLRTPIASLLVHLENAAAQVDDATRPTLVTALGEGMYLAGMIEDLWVERLLELSPDPSRVTPVDLCAVVQRVLARHAPLGRERRVMLNGAWPDTPVVVQARPLLVERALGNLVHNALTHHPPSGGHAAIVLEVDGSSFTVQVVDDGSGMPPRADDGVARRRDPNGGGMGLSITRGVCERYGWRLRFSTPETGRGTLVLIEGTIDAAALG